MMRIGLDFDEVIAHSHYLKREVAKELFGVDIPTDEFVKAKVIERQQLTIDQFMEVGRVVYEERTNLLPVSGAMHHILELMRSGHELKVITSRSGKGLEVAQGWLAQHQLDIEIVGIGYGKEKTDATTGLHVYVDDDLDKLTPLVSNVPNLLLLSYPYKDVPRVPSEITKVRSWGEIYQHLWDIP